KVQRSRNSNSVIQPPMRGPSHSFGMTRVETFEKAASLWAGVPLFLGALRFRSVLLGVNHDALERVDCPQHLGILRLDEIFFVVRLEILFAAHREKGTLLFGTHRNADIRRDPVPVNRHL